MHIRFSTAFLAVVITSVVSAGLRADPATPAKPAAPTASSDPPSVTVLSSHDAQGVLGREVRGAADEDMGRIVDIVVDRDGKPRAAVIDFGGFLGVGSRKIAVDWNALKFGNIANKDQKVTLALTKNQVRAAPEYKDEQTVVVLGASGKLSPLEFGPER
jgi:hypothetical protein